MQTAQQSSNDNNQSSFFLLEVVCDYKCAFVSVFVCMNVCVEVWWNHSGMYCRTHGTLLGTYCWYCKSYPIPQWPSFFFRVSLYIIGVCKSFWCVWIVSRCLNTFYLCFYSSDSVHHYSSILKSYYIIKNACYVHLKHFYSMANLPNVSANVEVSEVEDLMRKKDKFPNHIHRSSNACVKQHFSSWWWSSQTRMPKIFGRFWVFLSCGRIACDTTPFLMICDLLRDPLCIVCTVVINLIWSNLNT